MPPVENQLKTIFDKKQKRCRQKYEYEQKAELKHISDKMNELKGLTQSWGEQDFIYGPKSITVNF